MCSFGYSVCSWIKLIAVFLLVLLFTYKCYLLITFANSLNPDQAQQNVWPDLDQNCLMVFLKEFLKKRYLEKNQQAIKKQHAILPSIQS